MKNLAAVIFSLTIAAICIVEPVRAQLDAENAAPDAPIVPMDIRFQHASQYLMQRIGDDPRYSEIEAVLDTDRTEVILRTRQRKSSIRVCSIAWMSCMPTGLTLISLPFEFKFR
jgi:hypothetical protein